MDLFRHCLQIFYGYKPKRKKGKKEKEYMVMGTPTPIDIFPTKTDKQ